MLLVADSGSTKCDWLVTSSGEEEGRFHTMGFNPFFHDSELIKSEILKNEGLAQLAPSIKELYFYGAGVSSVDRIAIVEAALKQVFVNAEILVDHDLLGSVFATCGDDNGISCILGTGSNSCLYQGGEIYEEVPALGYILGDEASGAYFGKEILKLFLYHDLPEEINQALISEYKITKEGIFESVYKQPNANVYLASFVRVLSDFKEMPWVKELLLKGFETFLKVHVCKYKNHLELPIHFVGSVAFHFQEVLKEACVNKGLSLGVITNEPILNLLKYHWDRRKT